MRIKIFFKIVYLVFLILLFGLFYVQIIRGNFYYELSQKNCIRLIPQAASRGNILDRNGKVLVDDSLSFAVTVIPQDLADEDKTFSALSKILKVDKDSLIRAYKRRYTAPFAPVAVKDNLTKKEALLLEENKYKIGGVFIQTKPKRRYPYKKAFSHIIGYLSEVDKSRLTKLKSYGYKIKDIMGYTGIEEVQDSILRSEEGGMQVEVDNKGRLVRLLGLRPSQKGADVKLTIDLDMQRIAYQALGERKGCIIIMDPFSGKILAMVSNPGYDPSIFVENKRRKIIRLLNDSRAPFVNRAISGLYPPASLFKLVTAPAGLETKKISSSTTFFCNGGLKVGNRVFKCWDEHGQVDLYQAIVHSCDIFFYQTGLLLGPEKLSDYALKFGLSKPTSIDIRGEASGFVPTINWKRWKRHQNWFKGDTVNFSIGQGDLLVTPIQMLRLVSAFANGGFLVKPYLVEEIDNKPYLKNRALKKKIAVKRKYWKVLKQALISTVEDEGGTAHILDIPNVSIAGKTGTAQVNRGSPHGWFIGFAPTDKTKISFCVFLEHGGSSSVACSVAREMLKRLLKENLI